MTPIEQARQALVDACVALAQGDYDTDIGHVDSAARQLVQLLDSTPVLG